MSLFYKRLIMFLCAIVMSCLVAFKTTPVFAQVEIDQSPCPITLLLAVFEGDSDVAETLLEYGADPNVSLENCRDVGIEEFEALDQFPRESSLLHIAVRSVSGRLTPTVAFGGLYNLLVSYGADIDTVDATGRTPLSILQSKPTTFKFSAL